MKTRKTINVKNRIIAKNDILNLARRLMEQQHRLNEMIWGDLDYDNLPPTACHLELRVYDQNDTEYQFESYNELEKFINNDNRRILKLSFKIESTETGLDSIAIDIRHSDHSSGEIVIKSDDIPWVDSNYTVFSEEVASWKKQTIRNHQFAYYGLFLICSFVLLLLSALILNLLGIAWRSLGESAQYVIVFIIVLIDTLLFWIFIPRLFPSIEMQIGPEHLLKERRTRNLIYTVLILIIFPIVMGLFFKAF